jgi:hypothetical protein
MKQTWLCLALVVTCCTCINVWPEPASWKIGDVTINVDPNFTFTGSPSCKEASRILDEATNRYKHIIFNQETKQCINNCLTILQFEFTENECSQDLQLYNDETYELFIPK